MAGLGSYVKANPETAQKVIAGFVEGIHYYKTNPAVGVEALQSRGIDRRAAKEIYQKIADSYPSTPDPELISIKGVLESLPEERARKVLPENFVDSGPWKSCQKRVGGKTLWEKGTSNKIDVHCLQRCSRHLDGSFPW